MPKWYAAMITPAVPVRSAPRLRRSFVVADGHGRIVRADLAVSAQGVVEPYLDGDRVGDDVLTPGWTSYEWRLRYLTHDLTERLGCGREHVLGLALGNGWFHGRLGWTGQGHHYGTQVAGFAQLEIEFEDGHVQRVVTDRTWEALGSAVTEDDLYDGQTIDARRADPAWSDPAVGGVRVLDVDTSRLTAHAAPPVRRQQEVPAVRIWTSPSGATLADFGQNLVGWLRFQVQGPAGAVITVRHAEVLENGELGVRPLRTARATDRLVLSGGQDTFEPTFTFHGFRYVEIDGWPGQLRAQDLVAVVVHSDLRRTGHFECSDELLNQLHRNVVWSLRGNVVDVPTDCPQRDERLGWTGDLAVFAPTAAYLYDVRDFLADWIRDLAAEQAARDGLVGFVVPDVLKFMPEPADFPGADSTAFWSDAAVWVPWALWQAYGDRDLLAEQYPVMIAHVDRVLGLRSENGLWDSGFQFGDWLDPDAAPDRPADAKADKGVVATAALYRSTRTLAQAAHVLGRTVDAERYAQTAQQVQAAFGKHYVDADGRVRSDCTTVYALAIEFGLLSGAQRDRAGERLAELVEASGHLVSTGFAGTPYILAALTGTGHLETAYRLLLQRACPSWLYPVTMGATTIWERWDSMLPDGSINPGQMTSFNHYALGAVADWMHRTVVGISPAEPGYRRILVAPRPGGGITWASGSLETAHGRVEVSWRIEGAELVTQVLVPEGTSALLRLPGGSQRELAAGPHRIAVGI